MAYTLLLSNSPCRGGMEVHERHLNQKLSIYLYTLQNGLGAVGKEGFCFILVYILEKLFLLNIEQFQKDICKTMKSMRSNK